MINKRAVLLIIYITLFFYLTAINPNNIAASEPVKWALIIGIDQYESGDISSLKFAQADAKELEKTLVDFCDFSGENVFVLTNDGKNRMKPTRPNIVDWLVRLRKVIKPQDTFIFFFSGHGMSREKVSYLLTYDSITAPIENLELSALNMTTLKTLLEKIPATKKIVIIDACRNDPVAQRGTGDNLMTKSFANELKMNKAGDNKIDISATLYACSVGERSYEWQERSQGFFTFFLIQGLSGKAKDPSGNITLNSLVNYLETKVPEQIKLWKGNAIQTPWAEIIGTGSGRWVLSKGLNTSGDPKGDQENTLQSSQQSDRLSYIKLAEDAYKKGCYAEPLNENAIDYARKVLADDPDNQLAKTIELQAASFYEKEAIESITKSNFTRAIEIYARLAILFPDNKIYQEELNKLKNPKVPDITGKWRTSVIDGEINVYSNGNCVYSGFLFVTVSGTWKCTNALLRKFEILWEHGFTDYLTLSEDGNKLEGKNNEDSSIIMSRIIND